MKSLLRLRSYLKPYTWLIVFSITMLAIAVSSDLSVPRLTQTIIDRGINAGNMSVVIRTALTMVALTVVSAAGGVANALLAVRISQLAGSELRHDLFARVQSLSFGNLDHLQTGKLLTRLTSDVMQVLQLILMTMRMLIRAPLMIIGSLILLFLTNWQLALIMVVLMPAAMSIFVLFATYARPLFMQVQRRLDRLNTVMQESLAGVRVVKAFVRTDYENKRFDRANADLTQQSIKVGLLLALLMPLLQLIMNLGSLAVVWLGGLEAIHGSLTVGQIVAFNNYLLSVLFPLTFLGMMVTFVSSAEASAQRVLEVLDSEPLVQERPDARPLPVLQGRIAFENVSFGYNGDGQEPVLRDINLAIEPGEMTAILGATGSGKSTLISLVPRFYDVTAGRVTVDGIDVRDVTLASLRSQVSMVAQESVLFTGTIRDNIRYGRPDASDEEVVVAAQAAQAHDFIMSFPQGYDSLVGQRGVNLSGGQKQRLTIARALLMQPRILLLDDSTSAVDVETEVHLQRSLGAIMAGRTSLMIAQRISSVMNADRIVVLERGQVAAVGRHDELMESCALYREIYQSQLGNGEA